MSQCRVEWDCKCQDVTNNTYLCLRELTEEKNTIVCQFMDNEDFMEAYDLNKDPYQLNNEIVEGNSNHSDLQWIDLAKQTIRRVLKESRLTQDSFENKSLYCSIIRFLKGVWIRLMKTFNA